MFVLVLGALGSYFGLQTSGTRVSNLGVIFLEPRLVTGTEPESSGSLPASVFDGLGGISLWVYVTSEASGVRKPGRRCLLSSDDFYAFEKGVRRVEETAAGSSLSIVKR